MKKIMSVLCLCLLIAGCGNGSAEETSAVSGNGSGIDVDLTGLTSSMVYGAIFDIMNNPENYIGQVMKIDGVYTPSYYDVTDRNYHYVLIADALACCQQGIEFVWNGEHVYPDDYPKEGDGIEIVGVFGKYSELGETYYYLSVNDVVHI